MRRTVMATGAAVALATALAACGSSSSSGGGNANAYPYATSPAQVSGSITVLTNRTDLIQDGTYQGYAKEFEKLYPKVKVTFQGYTNYDGDVATRMNGGNYGDVLDIPSTTPLNDYPHYFAELGTQAQMSSQYRFTDQESVNGVVYALPGSNTAGGYVYNKAVWAKAGITTWPKSSAEFLADLQAIKAKTSSIPYYTNYKDMWPVQEFANATGEPDCNPQAADQLTTMKDPVSPGKDLYIQETLLYDIVHDHLSEKDPTTTNWETSKDLIATGKIATMYLGSWAPIQMIQAAQKDGANPADIGFMPWASQVNGHWCSAVSPDKALAISAHSKYKAADWAWIKWFLNSSGQAAAAQTLAEPVNQPLPALLNSWQSAGVTMMNMTAADSIKAGKLETAAGVNSNLPSFFTGTQLWMHIVDLARGAASGSLQAFFNQQNQAWDQALATTG